MIRDLFAEHDSGVYLGDTALLDRLAQARLDALATDLRAEGWAWVEAVPHLSHADRQAFHTARQHAPRSPPHLCPASPHRPHRLRPRRGLLSRGRGQGPPLQQQRDALAANLDTLQSDLLGYPPDVRAVAGAIVTMGQEGEAVTLRGLLREAEARALDTLERLKRGLAGSAKAADADDRDDGATHPRR